MQEATICIFESQQIIRKRISTFSKERVISVNSVEGVSGIRLLLNTKPLFKLILLELDTMDRVNVCEFALNSFPDAKLVAVIRDNDPLLIKCLIGLGVHGILPSNAEPEDFVQAINALTNGFLFYHRTFRQLLKTSTQDIATQLQYINTRLTVVEEKVLLLTCQELTIKEISHQLSLSQHTVRNHRVRLMQRLGAKSVIGLVNFAYRRRVLAQLPTDHPVAD